MKKIYFIIFTFCILSLFQTQAQAHPEKRLLNALQMIQQGQFDSAELMLDRLLIDVPDFKLAHMIYADLQLTKSAPLQQVGMGLKNQQEKARLLAEVKIRYQNSIKKQDHDIRIPSALRRFDVSYTNAIVVDLNESRLYVFDNHLGYPRQVSDFYISMGRGGAVKEKEGDLRTPLGVYFVQSYIPSYKLADKYGIGAYPLNYPNAWDVFNGRTGSGIWLHGTRSGTYNRPPLASEGCVVMPNGDLLEVGSYITQGRTPVLIGQNIEWLSIDQWKKQKDFTSSIFQNWVDDWKSLDVDAYLSHYSNELSNTEETFEHWLSEKRRVAQQKTFIKLNISEVSLLMHPNVDLMVATFKQKYESNNHSSEMWKRIYWRKEQDKKWRIVFEGSINKPSLDQVAGIPQK